MNHFLNYFCYLNVFLSVYHLGNLLAIHLIRFDPCLFVKVSSGSIMSIRNLHLTFVKEVSHF